MQQPLRNLTALILGLATCQAMAQPAVTSPPGPDDAAPVHAIYAEPTDRHDHNIMGRIRGWSRLEVDVTPCPTCRSGATRIRADQPRSRVFEDFAPRLWDITGDGRPEIVTVESDLSKGARLAVWGVTEDAGGASLRRLATTDPSGGCRRGLGAGRSG